MQGTESKPFIRRKVAFVGDRACGKSSLLRVFSLAEFPTYYSPTVSENYITNCIVVDNPIQLVLWDTSCQNDIEGLGLRHLAYSEAHATLLGFSLDSPHSLKSVHNRWLGEMHRQCRDVPVILVGLKKDLREDRRATEPAPASPLPFVTIHDGMLTAQSIGAQKYMKCSSLRGEAIDDVFEAATRAALSSVETVHGKQNCVIF